MLEKLSIENYDLCEVEPTKVGSQIVFFTTVENEREDGSMWDYRVEVTSSTGECATCGGTQWSAQDSAYHTFKDVYIGCCQKLGIEPLID